MEFIKWMDNLPLWAKIIFALPFLDMVWGIYRLIKGIEKNNSGLIILGIVWIIFEKVGLFLVDLITIAVYGHPILTDEL